MNNSTFVESNSNDRTSIENAEPARLLLYRNAIQKCLQNVSSPMTREDFHSLFENLPSFRKKKRIIDNFYNILTTYINKNVHRQLEEHIKEENLHEKFATLEKLIQENETTKNKTMWRPSYDAENDLRSYRMQEKLSFKEELERMVLSKEDSVNKLKDSIIEAETGAKKIEKQMDDAEQYFKIIEKYIDHFSKLCIETDTSSIPL